MNGFRRWLPRLAFAVLFVWTYQVNEKAEHALRVAQEADANSDAERDVKNLDSRMDAIEEFLKRRR